MTSFFANVDSLSQPELRGGAKLLPDILGFKIKIVLTDVKMRLIVYVENLRPADTEAVKTSAWITHEIRHHR